MKDIDDIDIADSIKEQWEEDQVTLEALRDIEDNHLPDDAVEAERMLVRAWLLGQEIVHIEYSPSGDVTDYVGFETAEAEDHPPIGKDIDRFDLRGCESPAEVLELIRI